MNLAEKLIYLALKRACPFTGVLTAVFLAGSPLMAQPAIVQGTRINYANNPNTITISGQNFGAAPPAVVLGATTLGLVSNNNTTLVANLPGDLANGSYLLTVTPHNGLPVVFVVAYGTLTEDPGMQNVFVGGPPPANTGSNNTAVGAYTLLSNTTGNSNTATGDFALISNTTGFQNTVSGVVALLNNTTGVNNTASGYSALRSNTTGNNNTAVGISAGGNLVGGSSNIMVGSNAGNSLTLNESNNIDIGNAGVTGESGVIRIGDIQTATYIAGISGVDFHGGLPVLIDSNGQLGTVRSSRRYKEDIQTMGAASDGLLRLRPVTFRYKKPLDDGSKPVQYGLIAEEVAEVYPDLVALNKDGQIETVQYYKLDAMLLNEVQKLAKAHAADQAEIARLQSQVAEQAKLAQAQQAAMKQMLAQVHGIQQALASDRAARPDSQVARAAAATVSNPR